MWLVYTKAKERPGVVLLFPFIHDDCSVITSHCMVYYILIYRKDEIDITLVTLKEFLTNFILLDKCYCVYKVCALICNCICT